MSLVGRDPCSDWPGRMGIQPCYTTHCQRSIASYECRRTSEKRKQRGESRRLTFFWGRLNGGD